MSLPLSNLTRSPSQFFEVEGKAMCEKEKEPKKILPQQIFTIKACVKIIPIQLILIEYFNLSIIRNSKCFIKKFNTFLNLQQLRMYHLFVAIMEEFPISHLLILQMDAYKKTINEKIEYMDNMITHLQKVSPSVNTTVTIMQKQANIIKKWHCHFVQQKIALENSFPEKIDQAKQFKILIRNSHYIVNIIPLFNKLNNQNKNFLKKIFIFNTQ